MALALVLDTTGPDFKAMWEWRVQDDGTDRFDDGSSCDFAKTTRGGLLLMTAGRAQLDINVGPTKSWRHVLQTSERARNTSTAKPTTHQLTGRLHAPISPSPLLPTAGKSCQGPSSSIMERISGRWGCVSPTGWVNPHSKSLCEPTTRKKNTGAGPASTATAEGRLPLQSGANVHRRMAAGLHRHQRTAGQTAAWGMRGHGRLSENPGVRRARLLASSNIGGRAGGKKRSVAESTRVPVGYAHQVDTGQDLHGTSALQE